MTTPCTTAAPLRPSTGPRPMAGLLGALLLSAACGATSTTPANCTSAAAEGTSCGAGLICAAGACVAAAPRTVASAFTTTWWPSSGAMTTARVPQAPGTTVSALVPDGSASGYQVFPGTLAADGAFAIPGVPGGRYLLRTDLPSRAFYYDLSFNLITVDFTRTVLTEFASSTPSLESLVGSRQDLAMPTTETATLNFSNLEPWGSSDRLWLTSQDAAVDSFVFASLASQAGATAISVADQPWSGFGGIPDLARDVLYGFQRKVTTVGGVTTRLTSRYARIPDLTFAGGAAVVDVPLLEAPLSQGHPVNLKKAAYAALLPGVAPELDPAMSTVSAGVYATQHSNGYPAPPGMAMRYFYLSTDAQPADQDLGTIAYGGFAEPGWAQFRIAGLSYTANVFPGSGSAIAAYGAVLSYEPVPGASTPIAPVLGPVSSPRINGLNAFSTLTGVGLQPTISWSAPGLGTPTAYLVRIVPAQDSFSSEVLLAVLYSARSFKVPPGVLEAGKAYYATITAVRGPQYAIDRSPNLSGYPLHVADLITAAFVP